MTESAPEVSVIVPYLRAEATIERALTSVLDQTLARVELIAVSDGSTDGSSSIVARIAASDPRVRRIALPTNRGPSYARNRGVETATGRWIAVLDADDAFTPDRLGSLVAAAGDASVVVDNLMGIDPSDDSEVGPVYGALPARLDACDVVATKAPGSAYNFGYLKPLYRRSLVAANGIRYVETLRTGEDMLFLVECALVCGSIATLDRPLYRYRLQVSPKSKALSSMSHSLPVDRDIAAALQALASRRTALLDAGCRDAIAARVDDLLRYADVATFRHLLFRRQPGPALRLLARSPEVRRYARGFVARKLFRRHAA